MAGLFRNDPTTRSGKFPVLLRRDGTVPEWEWFVLGSRDPAAITAIRHYADEAKSRGWDPQYATDLYALAERWLGLQSGERLDRIAGICRLKEADPDAGPHRTDDPAMLTFPGSLAEFVAGVRAEALAAQAIELGKLVEERDRWMGSSHEFKTALSDADYTILTMRMALGYDPADNGWTPPHGVDPAVDLALDVREERDRLRARVSELELRLLANCEDK